MNKDESFEKLNRLDKILKKHSKSLQKAVGDRDYDNIYKEIGESLFWIIHTNDFLIKRFRRIFLDCQYKDAKNLLFGLRFAYNLYKHDVFLFELGEDRKREVSFLKVKEYRWKDYEGEVKDSCAYNAYENNLKGDVILGTMGTATKFLRKTIKKIIESH